MKPNLAEQLESVRRRLAQAPAGKIHNLQAEQHRLVQLILAQKPRKAK